MNLIDTVADNVTTICCSVLCYKLKNISTTAPLELLLLPDAQYYVRKQLAESYREFPRSNKHGRKRPYTEKYDGLHVIVLRSYISVSYTETYGKIRLYTVVHDRIRSA